MSAPWSAWSAENSKVGIAIALNGILDCSKSQCSKPDWKDCFDCFGNKHSRGRLQIHRFFDRPLPKKKLELERFINPIDELCFLCGMDA
jgi:hypothetical protein